MRWLCRGNAVELIERERGLCEEVVSSYRTADFDANSRNKRSVK